MSLAIAVRIAGSSVRSIAGAARRARKSATTSIASVAEPPLPSASSLPPRSKLARSCGGRCEQDVRVVGQRLRAERADSRRLHQHRAAHVLEHRLEVALALVEERVQEARRAGVVHSALAASLEQAAVLEEHVDELPQHVVERLDQLLADVRVAARRLELPLRARAGREGDRQAAAVAGEREGRAPPPSSPSARSRSRCRRRRRSARPALRGRRPRRRGRSPAAPACRRSPGERTRPRRGARPSAPRASARTRSAGRRGRTARPSGGRAVPAASASASKNRRAGLGPRPRAAPADERSASSGDRQAIASCARRSAAATRATPRRPRPSAR